MSTPVTATEALARMKQRCDDHMRYMSYGMACGIYGVPRMSFRDWLAWTNTDEYKYDNWLRLNANTFTDDECHCEE